MTGDLTTGGWCPGHHQTDPAVLNESSDELAAALTVLAAHTPTLVPGTLQRLRKIWQPRQPAQESAGTPQRARQNVHRHYDLSNEMFELFLDPTMTYSSGLYPDEEADVVASVLDPGDGLEQAQLAKIDSILDLAGVRAGMRVIEIGTGWGALAIRAAAERGALVTTLTLSTEQQRLARHRIATAGLSDQINVRLEDYRDHASAHHGAYDAAVSVEMIEAVGEKHWPVYFSAIDRMLRPGAKLGLQAITIDHPRLHATRGGYTWIHKYIFPGGQLPSLPAIDDVLTHNTRLRILERRGLGRSYARTLATWRHNFNTRAADIAARASTRPSAECGLLPAYSQAGFDSGLPGRLATADRPQLTGDPPESTRCAHLPGARRGRPGHPYRLRRRSDRRHAAGAVHRLIVVTRPSPDLRPRPPRSAAPAGPKVSARRVARRWDAGPWPHVGLVRRSARRCGVPSSTPGRPAIVLWRRRG